MADLKEHLSLGDGGGWIMPRWVEVAVVWSERLGSRIEVVPGVDRGRILIVEDLVVRWWLHKWALDVVAMGFSGAVVGRWSSLCSRWSRTGRYSVLLRLGRSLEGSMIRMCVLGVGVVESLWIDSEVDGSAGVSVVASLMTG